jgi:DNA-binding IclR family transcriptional regulator
MRKFLMHRSKPRTITNARGNPDGTQSITRAVSLLREIAAHNFAGSRLVDLAAHTDLKAATAHRILASLVREGLVMHRRGSRQYFLGPLAYELGLASSMHFNLKEMSAPMLRRLARTTGDTVFLTVRSGADSVVIDRAEGGYPIKVLTQEIGARRPLGSTVGGLALLLELDDEEVEQIVAANTPRLARYGHLSVEVLRRMIGRSRSLGYGLNENDIFEGVTGVGVAIPHGFGRPSAALSVIAISSRWTPERREEVVTLLKESARQLGQVLSGE